MRNFADLLRSPPLTGVRVCCSSASDFEAYLSSLPMATPFEPFSNLERTVMAFTGGASFAAGSGTSATFISSAIQYATGTTTCFPSCVLISYSLSVGVGSVVSSKVGSKLSSYFLENYRSKWMAENAGKYFMEKGILKRIPLPKDIPPPEGLAFVTSLNLKGDIFELIQRIIVVNSIVYIIGFVVRKSKKFISSRGMLKKSIEIEHYESFNNEKFTDLDGLDIYHNLVSC